MGEGLWYSIHNFQGVLLLKEKLQISQKFLYLRPDTIFPFSQFQPLVFYLHFRAPIFEIRTYTYREMFMQHAPLNNKHFTLDMIDPNEFTTTILILYCTTIVQ